MLPHNCLFVGTPSLKHSSSLFSINSQCFVNHCARSLSTADSKQSHSVVSRDPMISVQIKPADSQIMGTKSSCQRKSKNPRQSLIRDIKVGPAAHVRLLWVHRYSSLYHRLSFNVAREIAMYMRDPPLFLAKFQRQVYLFCMDSKKFVPYFCIDKQIGYSIDNISFMDEEKVFMSLVNNLKDDPLEFAVYNEGLIQYLGAAPNKHGCEVIYDPKRFCVYIFGGRMSYSDRLTSTKEAEVFTHFSMRFRQMANMQHRRSNFACCWHSQLVYLCGGESNYVETFDPCSESFAEHSYIKGIGYIDFAASFDGELAFISRNEIWRERNGQWVATKRVVEDRNARSGTAAVWNGVAYCQYVFGVVGVELEEGQDKNYSPISKRKDR